MDAILELAERFGLIVVEDACQAHGARRDGIRAGSAGRAAAFSFYPAKNLGAMWRCCSMARSACDADSASYKDIFMS